jgi:hypothetical protein
MIIPNSLELRFLEHKVFLPFCRLCHKLHELHQGYTTEVHKEDTKSRKGFSILYKRDKFLCHELHELHKCGRAVPQRYAKKTQSHAKFFYTI